jgi:hypothetical protein
MSFELFYNGGSSYHYGPLLWPYYGWHEVSHANGHLEQIHSKK